VRSYKQAASAEVARQGGHVAEMQRRRVLLAFVEVLAEQGLENASVGRVCKRAGVSRRTFYELFDDRDECLLAALDAAVERLAQPVVAAYEAERNWCERIRGALTVLLERLDAEPDVARMCVVETLKAGPLVAARRAAVLAAFVAAVEEGRGEARRGSEPPPLAGQGVVGGALSVIHARLLDCPPAARSPEVLAEVPSATGRPRTRRSSHGAPRPLGASPHLVDLTGALMAMVVHPYLGAAAARRELERPAPKAKGTSNRALKDPFKDLSIRFTYRTARVLATIAANTGASNRLVADNSGIGDEGQMSRLLTRLLQAGLIENRSEGRDRGEANSWALTERGEAVQAALGTASQ
jgi:AcrR family transcriptional regulator/DNA-binding MarR family transcriptional regulator